MAAVPLEVFDNATGHDHSVHCNQLPPRSDIHGTAFAMSAISIYGLCKKVRQDNGLYELDKKKGVLSLLDNHGRRGLPICHRLDNRLVDKGRQ